MSTVASVDYAAKRIYLSAATVGVALDTVQVYRDVRSLRAATPAHRNHKTLIVAGGNIQKTATTFTQPYVQLAAGCRLVPHGTPHSLVLVRETFTSDGQSGVGCFDRSTVASEVDIDVQVSPVEVRVVFGNGGSSLTLAQIEASSILAKEATAQRAATNATNALAAVLAQQT